MTRAVILWPMLLCLEKERLLKETLQAERLPGMLGTEYPFPRFSQFQKLLDATSKAADQGSVWIQRARETHYEVLEWSCETDWCVRKKLYSPTAAVTNRG